MPDRDDVIARLEKMSGKFWGDANTARWNERELRGDALTIASALTLLRETWRPDWTAVDDCVPTYGRRVWVSYSDPDAPISLSEWAPSLTETAAYWCPLEPPLPPLPKEEG